MKYFLALTFFIGLSSNIHAQRQKLDSMLAVLPMITEDTTRIKTLNLISESYVFNTDLGDSANFYALKALNLCRKLLPEAKDSADIFLKRNMGASYNTMGMVVDRKSSYDEALDYYTKALQLRIESGYKKGVAGSYNNIGIIHHKLGHYAIALENYLKAIKINEELNNKSWLSKNFTAIGNLHEELGNNSEALAAHKKALELQRELNEKRSIPGTLINLGNVNKNLGNYDEAKANYLEALGNEKAATGMKSIANSMLGNLYLIKDDLDSALYYYLQGYELSKNVTDQYGKGTQCSNIGNIYLKKKEYDAAQKYLEEGLRISEETGVKVGQRDCLEKLIGVMEAKGNLPEALNYYRKYSALKDSMLNTENTKTMNEMKVKYDTEKKDKEIEILSKDQQIQVLNLSRQRSELDKTYLLSEKQKQEIEIKNLSLEKSASDLKRKEQEKALQEVTFQRTNAELKEQNAVREREVDRQKFIRNIIITSIILSSFIGFLLFNRYQLRKKIESQQAILTERVRISRELHDDVGAQLSTAKLFLNDLKKNFNSDNGKELLDNSLGLLETSIKDLRVVMDDLRQSTLKDDGYIAATEELVNTINQRHGIRFNMSHHGITDRLPQVTEHNLFRITQELINNTLKYAEAKKVTIDIVKQTDKIVFTYDDDGKGFDQGKAIRGYGLSNIESRIKALDGHLEINSSPGNGFMAMIEIPVAKS